MAPPETSGRQAIASTHAAKRSLSRGASAATFRTLGLVPPQGLLPDADKETILAPRHSGNAHYPQKAVQGVVGSRGHIAIRRQMWPDVLSDSAPDWTRDYAR